MKKQTIGTLLLAVLLTVATNLGVDNANPHAKAKANQETKDNVAVGSEMDHRGVNQVVKVASYWNVPLSHQLQDYIRSLCNQYGVSESLVYAVMKTESNFNPNKISSTGDYGLMQINLVNQPWLREKLGIKDFLNPYDSVKAGVYMLSNLQNKYHDGNRVLMAYNRGEGAMMSLTSRGVSFTDYTEKVIENLKTIKKSGGVYVEKHFLESPI